MAVDINAAPQCGELALVSSVHDRSESGAALATVIGTRNVEAEDQ